jgi:DNA (cytosine-5)-methyltransferase 1
VTAAHLRDFLRFPTRLLSARATAGFLKRTRLGSLRFVPGFLDAVEAHLDKVGPSSNSDPAVQEIAAQGSFGWN